MTAEQLDLLDIDEAAEDARRAARHAATAAREDAIRRADEHANDSWKLFAFDAVSDFAMYGEPFTADDVWDALAQYEYTTPTPSALGPVFLRASRAGLIRKTGELRLSRNPRRHRDLVVWVGT